MGLCFGERQRLKGEAHTPRGDALFAPVQRSKWREQKLWCPNEERHFHRKKWNSHTQQTKKQTTTDDFCLHTLHTPLHHIGYFFDVQDCCLKRTQFLACGAPPLAVVTFESNLNTMNLKVLVRRCWLGKKRVVVVCKVVCGKKKKSRRGNG